MIGCHVVLPGLDHPRHRSVTARRRPEGATLARATGLDGSSSRNANAASGGTSSSGGPGGVDGSVWSRNAPAKRWAPMGPVSSSIVMGAVCGTTGRSGTTTLCLITVSR